MTKLRLFVALELPSEMLEELTRAQDELRKIVGGKLSWVRPQGMHLTLKFLGAVDESRLDEVRGALERGAAETRPLRLQLGELGTFGGNRPRVVWVGVEGDIGALARLQVAVDREMGGLGFATENRPYHPHLTLARVSDDFPRGELRVLADTVAGAAGPRPVSSRFDEVSLMLSTLRPAGAIYEQLAVASLGSPRS